jgi:hypothetical protein
MQNRKLMKLDEFRQPGMRRILEAVKAIERETPTLISQASIARSQLGKVSDGTLDGSTGGQSCRS